MLTDDRNKKRHRDRKSPGAAEAWRKQKKARSAARGNQIWLEGLGWARNIPNGKTPELMAIIARQQESLAS